MSKYNTESKHVCIHFVHSQPQNTNSNRYLLQHSLGSKIYFGSPQIGVEGHQRAGVYSLPSVPALPGATHQYPPNMKQPSRDIACKLAVDCLLFFSEYLGFMMPILFSDAALFFLQIKHVVFHAVFAYTLYPHEVSSEKTLEDLH